MILIGNEFLDALPVRQFVRRGTAWTERFVANAAFIEEPSEFTCDDEMAEGDVVERREDAEAIGTTLASRLLRHKGAALLLDYGPETSGKGDTLQAIRGGRPADPLASPGTADLTAHVNFAHFGAAAREAGADVQGPIPQGLFLARLGLFQRTNRLARQLAPRDALRMMEAARRLAEPDRMGRLFKAIALASPGIGIVPGFA